MTNERKYKIIGGRIGGPLAKRLDEIKVHSINDLQGVVVHTSRGPYYSEIYDSASGRLLPREQLTEETKGLVEYITNLAAKARMKKFTINSNSALAEEILLSHSQNEGQQRP